MPTMSSTHEERAAYMREWRRRNPRKVKHQNIYGRYGMTVDEFEAKLVEQEDRCLVCLRTFDPDPAKRDRHIDHNHDTGEFRGIVCARCNAILGRVDRDVEILKRAVAYLERIK
jgi:Recombination endonuclease VII